MGNPFRKLLAIILSVSVLNFFLPIDVLSSQLLTPPCTSETATSIITTTQNPAGLTLHFKKPANWGGVNIHHWLTKSDTPATEWPGPAMTDDGDGWWSYTISGQTAARMIFNDHGSFHTKELWCTADGWYNDDNSWYATKPASSARGLHIVVLGSSTAEGMGPVYSWVDRLRDHAKWVNGGHQVTNLAGGGLRSYHYLPTGSSQRYGHLANPEHNITKALSLNPDVVLLNNTSNDVWEDNFDVDQIMGNYQEIVDTAKAAGVSLYLTTSQPTRYDQAMRDRLILIYSRVVSDFPSIYVDFWTDLANADGTSKDAFAVEGDSVHLNDAAHLLFYKRMRTLGLLGSVTVPQTKLVHYYTTEFNPPSMHYRFDDDTWTTTPGSVMTAMGGNWYTVTVNDEDRLFMVFNDGGSMWDNNNGMNYSTLFRESWVKDGQVYNRCPRNLTTSAVVDSTSISVPTLILDSL